MYISTWYTDQLPHGTQIGVSANGWTDDTLGFYWIQNHFEQHIRSRTKDVYRLLIIDQPLGVSCFISLKQVYGHRIEDLMRAGYNHIDKED